MWLASWSLWLLRFLGRTRLLLTSDDRAGEIDKARSRVPEPHVSPEPRRARQDGQVQMQSRTRAQVSNEASPCTVKQMATAHCSHSFYITPVGPGTLTGTTKSQNTTSNTLSIINLCVHGASRRTEAKARTASGGGGSGS